MKLMPLWRLWKLRAHHKGDTVLSPVGIRATVCMEGLDLSQGGVTESMIAFPSLLAE